MLPRRPRLREEVYYIDNDKNLLRAIVTRIYTDEFLGSCPTGTHFVQENNRVFIVVPENTKWEDVKLPRGFMVDLEVTLAGSVSIKEKVPYNPITHSPKKADSLGANSWVF